MKVIRIFLIALTLGLSACVAEKQVYAPVTDVSAIEPIPQSGFHRVLPGESFYAIAWRYGLDYRYLAIRNNIKPPYTIYTGQIIYLTNARVTKSIPVKPIEREPNRVVNDWRWPARGRLIGTFSPVNRGINIAGVAGDPIFATASGKVVYSGDGLRGYGNLIIIKHNSSFLSAYAHNRVSFVKEGEWVRAGQEIAEMGKTGTYRVMLHFEIRRNGKPVNPMLYLKRFF